MTLSANEIDAIESACREAMNDEVLSGIRPQFVVPLIARIRELLPALLLDRTRHGRVRR